MVARLFGPGLFSFVAACGFGTAAATGICFSCSMNHSARRLGRRFRLPHGEHGVFDVRRERDANTDLCRYVSYGSWSCKNAAALRQRRMPIPPSIVSGLRTFAGLLGCD
jgi:hypothetical protein